MLTLPNTLLTHSKAFLWRTSQFNLYYQVIDIDPYKIDLRDYSHLSSPTYEEPQSQQTFLDLLHTINRRQLHVLKAEGKRWYEESTLSFGKVTEIARDNPQHMLDAWCHVECQHWPEDDMVGSSIHGLSLEWGARAIVGLLMELEIWGKGFLKYQTEYQGHNLWWQQVKVY